MCREKLKKGDSWNRMKVSHSWKGPHFHPIFFRNADLEGC